MITFNLGILLQLLFGTIRCEVLNSINDNRLFVQGRNQGLIHFYLIKSMIFLNISYLTWVDHSVYNTVFPWFPGWAVRTVRRYPDRNWLRGLWHPLHLPHESVAVMERAVMETNIWALPGFEPETLRTRVKTLTTVPPGVSRCSSISI